MESITETVREIFEDLSDSYWVLDDKGVVEGV